MEDGTLVTASQLDYETETMHILSVEVVDGGDPPLSGVAMVTVMITDVNDNAPVFEGEENELVIAEVSTLAIGSTYEISFYLSSIHMCRIHQWAPLSLRL